MTCEQLIAAVREAVGPNLKSVVLYGSAATGDFVPGLSGHDVILVAEQWGASELAAVAATLTQFADEGNPVPQLFTQQELVEAADVFPIELVDVRQYGRVLFGDDPLAGIDTDMRQYRAQLERELKTRLQLLRRRYVTCSGNGERLAHLLAASVSTFLALLRAALRLYNEPAPDEKADALDCLAKHVVFDPQPIRAAIELRTRDKRPAVGELERLFDQYLQSIERVIHAVDRHLHPAATPTTNSGRETS